MGSLALFFYLPRALGTEFNIQRKPIAEIPPLLVRRLFRIWLRAVPAGTGKVKTAMAANTKVFTARTAHAAPQWFSLSYGLSAIPAHK